MARLPAETANKKIRWNRLITGHRERSQVAGEEVITWDQGKGFEWRSGDRGEQRQRKARADLGAVWLTGLSHFCSSRVDSAIVPQA